MNNLSVYSLQGLLLLFLDKRDDFANKNKEFYNPSIKKILTAINGMPHQLFSPGLQTRDIYPELKKYFYNENTDVTWEEFLTKFGLCIDTRSSTDDTLHGNAGKWRKVAYYLKLKKQLKPAAVTSHGTCLVLKMQWPT